MEQLQALYGYESLPYIDREADHPLVQTAVQQLIEAEMATFRPSPESYLRDYPYPELGERVKALIREQEEKNKRGGAGAGGGGVDLSRYAMEAPAAPQSSELRRDSQYPFDASCGAWHEAVARGKSMAEYQENRLQHLELQSQHVAPIWLKHISSLESSVGQLEAQIKLVDAECNSVNYQRMQEQEACGREMSVAWRKRDAALAGQLALQQAISAKKVKA